MLGVFLGNFMRASILVCEKRYECCGYTEWQATAELSLLISQLPNGGTASSAHCKMFVTINDYIFRKKQ